MRTLKKNVHAKFLTFGIILAMILLSFSSCTKRVYFTTSSVVPAANGEITVKSDKNNNYVIQMKITNLAEVNRLQPPKNSYIVWMETDRGLTKNIGRLTSNNNLNADFETISSFKPVKIFITAEEDESTQYPGTMVVLTTDRF